MTDLWSKPTLTRLSSFSVVLFVTSFAMGGTRVQRPTRSEVGPPAEAVAPPQADPLLVLVNDAISRTSRRFLDANRHTPWQIFHGLLALRKDFELIQNGRRIDAIDYVSNGARYSGDYWFEATPFGGRAHPFTIPYAFEGHVNQSLALLSMSDLPLNHQFHVRGGKVVTMADMVRHAKMTANTNEETTWTLWFLTNYVDQDEQWLNQNGEPWSMERLVQIQVRSDVTRAPCGGTHQLFALAFARNAYLDQQGRLSGAWTEADQKLRRYTSSARSLQNSDGSFSTAYFKGREFSNEFNERVKCSGHMLEWLMMALPERDLDETWVRRGVESLSRDLINNASQPADCGPLFHALDSLVMYRDRVTPALTPSTPPALEFVQTEPEERPAVRPEPPITIENRNEGVATTQTVARPLTHDLPQLDWVNEPVVRREPNLPPPPPERVQYEPAESDIAVTPKAASETNGAQPENDLPPLPPRRPVRSARADAGSTIH